MPKREFHKFLCGFSLTQLKDYTKQKHEEEQRSFKELSFYKMSIEKPYTKRLNNIDLFCELLVYDELKFKNIKSI